MPSILLDSQAELKPLFLFEKYNALALYLSTFSIQSCKIHVFVTLFPILCTIHKHLLQNFSVLKFYRNSHYITSQSYIFPLSIF
jgi:hypothetical protein